MKSSVAAVSRAGILMLAGLTGITFAGEGARLPRNNPQWLPDPSGAIENYSDTGSLASRGAFFESLGTNGRSCATCHVAGQAFGLSAQGAQLRYLLSGGRDPLFAAVDGANCPTAPGNRRASHSLLLQSGLIRISLPLPAAAASSPQFSISVVDDPYGCAMTWDPATAQTDVSVYRRPLPSTNLSSLSAVMFDGRETVQPLTSSATFRDNLIADLTQQASDAVLGHAQAAHPATAEQLADIVNFELALHSGQGIDLRAGALDADGALGGALDAASFPYHPGINDSLGADPSGAVFDANAMTLFERWNKLTPAFDLRGMLRDSARREIAAGEALFNTLPMTITNVRGLNDNAALGKPASFIGHCSTCHDTPNIGDHSLPLPLDIGTSHSNLPGMETDPAIVAALSQLSLPKLPVYLINGCPNPFGSGQPVSFYTTDPGRALITGNCSDLNRIKGPILRGLAARAPYFHNGAAATLDEVVNFYNERFRMNLTQQQKRQLVAFLNSL